MAFAVNLTSLHRGRLVYIKEVMTVTLFMMKEGLHYPAVTDQEQEETQLKSDLDKGFPMLS